MDMFPQPSLGVLMRRSGASERRAKTGIVQPAENQLPSSARSSDQLVETWSCSEDIPKAEGIGKYSAWTSSERQCDD